VGGDLGEARSLGGVDHGDWRVEAHKAALGAVAFVFEGRPNVLVDACGVLASGNTAVLRIGADAARTADAIMTFALRPALADAGLPAAAVTLVPALGHDAAWALFTDSRIGLAVARGSGPAVRRLGEIASQSGIPVSLHGVGGAWLIADESADAARFGAVVEASLDRKVCNTLNTCCIVRARAGDLVPAFVTAVEAAARRRGRGARIDVAAGSETWLDPALFDPERLAAAGPVVDAVVASVVAPETLGVEREWEATPEVALVIVDDLDAAIALFNRHAPRFVASLIATESGAHDHFYREIEAPFVGDGFTRWVDGQYALQQPELGLSNWEFGRPLGRSSILTGLGVHTVRLRMSQFNGMLRR
jgi:glutamate-5-semialdehyde dehydrogenase